MRRDDGGGRETTTSKNHCHKPVFSIRNDRFFIEVVHGMKQLSSTLIETLK